PEDLVVTQSPAVGTTGSEEMTVTITVKDEAGNISACLVTLTPVDTIPPVVECPVVEQEIEVDGNCEYVVPDFITDLDYFDNCTAMDDIIVAQSPAAGTILTGAVTVAISV